MVNNEKVTQVIFSVIDDVNQLLPKEQQLNKSKDSFLFGAEGELDSLGFINLIVAVEMKIEEVFGVTISLVDQEASYQEDTPFKTVGTLVNYVSLVIGKMSTNG